MCLTELIAGAMGSAYLGDILKEADISTYSADNSLVDEVEVGTKGMGKAGNGGREVDK